MSTNLNTIIIQARKILGNLTTKDYSDANAIIDANDAFNEFQLDLMSERSDFFTEKSTLNSIALNQSVVQFPTDLLMIKHVDVNFYDPTDYTKFYPATEFESGNTPQGYQWDWFLNNQPKNLPLIDIRGGYFEVAPKADAVYTNAIKILYSAKLQPTDLSGNPYADARFAATTDLLPYPLTMYPEILAYKMAVIFTQGTGQTNPVLNKANEFEVKYKEKLHKLINGVQTNFETLIAKSVQGSGWTI